LATGTPHAATTIATTEEMLNVRAPSPPVPHTSTADGHVRGSFTASARIARAKPPISWGRSPFMARPTSRPATCASLAWPHITARIAASASLAARSSRRASFWSSSANMDTCLR
jgi:hypothetical protein